jgi:uncharacterized protein YvpB
MKRYLFLLSLCVLLAGCGKQQEITNEDYYTELVTTESETTTEEITTEDETETEEDGCSESVESKDEYAYLDDNYDSEGNYIPEGYAMLDVEEILQNPELPTGCESVALTALLKYYGFTDLDKTYIADNYLIYSSTGDCKDGFIGDPHTTKGAGCFSNVMRQVADNYLYDQNANLAAYDLSGATINELLQSLDYGDPVLIWTTINMVEPSIDKSDLMVGDYEFYHNEHCVVLMGYNLDGEKLYIMDPLEGIVERDLDDFYDIYKKIGKYAVVIWQGKPVPSSQNGFGLEE